MRKIHTRTTFISIHIKGRLGGYIMADISDGNHNTVVTARAFASINCIIKITCIFAVYRDKWQIFQIHTPFKVCLGWLAIAVGLF